VESALMPAAPVGTGASPSASPVRRWLAAWRRAAAVVRRMIGVPDYDTYLVHMRHRYPGCAPLDRETFERERLTARYKATGSRCC
jgi:uncharacterized short protein YbdD (DUF466 family)